MQGRSWVLPLLDIKGPSVRPFRKGGPEPGRCLAQERFLAPGLTSRGTIMENGFGWLVYALSPSCSSAKERRERAGAWSARAKAAVISAAV